MKLNVNFPFVIFDLETVFPAIFSVAGIFVIDLYPLELILIVYDSDLPAKE